MNNAIYIKQVQQINQTEERIMERNIKDFPSETIKIRAWHIHQRKGVVVVDGFKCFDLKEMKKISLDIRLSFPPELFKAIVEA